MHNDYLGNVRAKTDASGSKIFYWVNYPFGKDYSVTGGTSSNYYRYTGKEYEPGTQLDFFGARYYHPDLGRFITPDQVFFVPSDKALFNPMRLNLYEHALNNPLKYVDPNGKDVFIHPSLTANVIDYYKGSELFRYIYDAARSNRNYAIYLNPFSSVEMTDWDGATTMSGNRTSYTKQIEIQCLINMKIPYSERGSIIAHELTEALTLMFVNAKSEDDFKNMYKFLSQIGMGKYEYDEKTKQGKGHAAIAKDNQSGVSSEYYNKGDDIQADDNEIKKPYLE